MTRWSRSSGAKPFCLARDQTYLDAVLRAVVFQPPVEYPLAQAAPSCGRGPSGGRFARIVAGCVEATGGSNSVVECQLPKLKVAGSTPVSRSTTFIPSMSFNPHA